jgi:hypothetical protein
MHFTPGLLVAGAILGASFLYLKPDNVVVVSGNQIPVADRGTVAIREDAVPTVIKLIGEAEAAPVRDLFVGNWSGECGDLVQCELNIEKTGKAYALELKVAEWNHADKVVCRLTGSMDISDDKQLLAGKLGSSPLSGVFLRGEGAIQLHDAPGEDCTKFYDLDGIYRILGD